LGQALCCQHKHTTPETRRKNVLVLITRHSTRLENNKDEIKMLMQSKARKDNFEYEWFTFPPFKFDFTAMLRSTLLGSRVHVLAYIYLNLHIVKSPLFKDGCANNVNERKPAWA
jgi:hypothetical protein